MITPLDYYQQHVDQGDIIDDPAQRAIMEKLQSIHTALIGRQRVRDSWLGKLRRKIKPREPIQGLYLWGDVGAGKSFLIDGFYSCLPVRKMRVHFHNFMQRIHNDLTRLQGQEDPLKIIAKQLSDQYLVICFDEFFVSNITDAMLLGELFKALFKGGLCLVTNSNSPPDDLYHNGLQRQRFLPAIEMIKTFTEVVKLDTQRDYRLRTLPQACLYYSPLTEAAEAQLENHFHDIIQHHPYSSEAIQLFGRLIQIRKQALNTVWFEFNAICGRPRSQKDYLALAKHYDIFFISHIPRLDTESPDLVVSFINLIDVLYDAGKSVVISAAVPILQLYTQGDSAFAFKRTESRLIEMQSEEYANRASEHDNH